MWIHDQFGAKENHQHKMKHLIHSVKSQYQRIEIVQTSLYGRVMLIDGRTQSSEADEFIWHEGIVHPALFSHPNPQRILCIGGGNGGVLREIVKHKSVTEIVLVEIDPEVISTSKEWLPFMTKGAFDDSRLSLVLQDGREYLENNHAGFDCVILDLPEPLPDSPPCKLFTLEFYNLLSSRLTDDGVIALQAGPAHPLYLNLYSSVLKTLQQVFFQVHPFTIYLPFFATEWGFALCTQSSSVTIPPSTLTIKKRLEQNLSESTRFLNESTCHRIFELPKHIQEELRDKGNIFTDDSLPNRF